MREFLTTNQRNTRISDLLKIRVILALHAEGEIRGQMSVKYTCANKSVRAFDILNIQKPAGSWFFQDPAGFLRLLDVLALYRTCPKILIYLF